MEITNCNYKMLLSSVKVRERLGLIFSSFLNKNMPIFNGH